MKEREKIPLGEVPVGGNIEIKSISFNAFDRHDKSVFYECQIIQDINMIVSGDIEINHTARLKFTLSDDVLEQMENKKLIKIKTK